MSAKKHMYYLYLVLILSFLLTGCNGENRELSPYNEVNSLNGISIEVMEETVKPTGLELVFQNTTDRADYSYSAWYRLEVYSQGEWLTMNPLPDVMWYQDDWDRPVQTQKEMGYDWEWYYGELSSGEYRIVISLFDRPIKEDYFEYYIAANFSIE